MDGEVLRQVERVRAPFWAGRNDVGSEGAHLVDDQSFGGQGAVIDVLDVERGGLTVGAEVLKIYGQWVAADPRVGRQVGRRGEVHGEVVFGHVRTGVIVGGCQRYRVRADRICGEGGGGPSNGRGSVHGPTVVDGAGAEVFGDDVNRKEAAFDFIQCKGGCGSGQDGDGGLDRIGAQLSAFCDQGHSVFYGVQAGIGKHMGGRLLEPELAAISKVPCLEQTA